MEKASWGRAGKAGDVPIKVSSATDASAIEIAICAISPAQHFTFPAPASPKVADSCHPIGCTLANMQVKILGSAAGGGFPQWNCACANCSTVRGGTFRGKTRTQTQAAISADGESWFLLGASPDLRAQIEATPELHPQVEVVKTASEKTVGKKTTVKKMAGQKLTEEKLTEEKLIKEKTARQSPIAGVVLANADVDHVFGLLLLRELQPLRVYATKSVRRILTKDNSMFAMLERVPDQVQWIEFAPGAQFPLLNPAAEDSGLRCRSLSLGTHFPAYVSPPRRSQLDPLEASLGLMIDSPSGKRLAFMPAVPRIDASLLKQLDTCDVLLFDGTFWSQDELIRTQGGGRTAGQTANEMGHVPVSAADGTLVRLAQLRRPRKIYVHINNTNPMLNEAGPEFRQVREAGWEIAEDGWQLEL
jgi:pyrroloquinoline quinone biosynthesis protein B